MFKVPILLFGSSLSSKTVFVIKLLFFMIYYWIINKSIFYVKIHLHTALIRIKNIFHFFNKKQKKKFNENKLLNLTHIMTFFGVPHKFCPQKPHSFNFFDMTFLYMTKLNNFKKLFECFSLFAYYLIKFYVFHIFFTRMYS